MPLPSGGGLGGLGNVGQIPNVNLGGLVQGATPWGGNPGIAFLQGLAAIPGIFQQAQYDASQSENMRQTMLESRMKLQQGQWDQMVAMIQKDNGLAADPNVIKRMTFLSKQLGYELPMDKQGKIDPSVWGTSWADFIKDKDWQERWFQATPDQRRAMAKMMNIQGVPDDAYTMAPVLTAGEQVLHGKLQLDASLDQARENNLNAAAMLDTTKAGYIKGPQSAEEYARARAAIAGIGVAQENATTKRMAVNQQMAMLKYRMNAMMQIAMKSNKTKEDIANLVEYGRELEAEGRNATTAMDDYAKTLGTAYGAGVDESQLTGLANELTGFQQQYQTIQDQGSLLLKTIKPTMNDGNQSRAVSGQSGRSATVTTQGQGGDNVPAGTIQVNPQGQRFIKGNDGTWYRLPPQ